MADVSLASSSSNYMSGSIKWSGLASGVDFSSVVEQLVEIEKTSIYRLESWREEWVAKNESLTGLNTRMQALELNARDMDSFSEFYKRVSTSSNSSVLSATNTSLATPGSHTVVVGQDIAGQIISKSYDSTAAVGGTVGDSLTIQVGSSSITLTGVSGAPAAGEYNIDGTIADLATAIQNHPQFSTVLDNVEVREDKDRGGVAYQRLVLTAAVPVGGPSEDITVTADPTNLSLNATSVDPVVLKEWLGSTCTPIAGGTYTGTTNKTFTFAVSNTGQLGVDDIEIKWADNEGNSGTIEIDAATYDPATEYDVFQGVTVQFDNASGDHMVKAEAFTIDAQAPVLQQAQDKGLAKAERRVHSGFVDLITPVHTGSSSADFVYYYEGQKITVTISPDTKLEGLVNAINDDVDNPGVEASIINDGEGTSTSYHLVLTGKDTGAEHSIRFDDANPRPLNNFTVTEASFDMSQKASDSMIKVDGFPSSEHKYIRRSINTVSDIIDGVILELTGAGETTVTISNDVNTIKANIEQFIQSINFVQDYIRQETKYDSESGESGVMIGNYTYDIVRNSINEILFKSIPGLDRETDEYTLLSQIGIHTDPDQDGVWIVESSVLKEALDNDIEAVARLFVNASDRDIVSTGVADRIYKKMYEMTDDTTGIANVLIDNYNGIIDQIDSKIANEERRIALVQERLEEKFARLESALGELDGQSTYLESQLEKLPKVGS